MREVPHILVVDDEESIRFTFTDFLSEAGYRVTTVASYEDAVAITDARRFDLLFVDIILEGRTGIDLLRTVRAHEPNTQAIIVTGAPTVDTAADAMRLGAIDYLVKPIRQEALLKATRLALKHKQLADEKDRCRSNVAAIFTSIRDGIITVNDRMRIIEANRAALELCGLPGKAVAGRTLASVLGDCSRGCLTALRQALEGRDSDVTAHVECRCAWNPGQVVSVSAAPLKTHRRQAPGCVMVLRDETQLHQMERRVETHEALNTLVGNCHSMTKIKELVGVLAAVDTTVLITGASGTGKELVVDALHRLSPRAGASLVKVNCAALPETLLESELFGHVQGAYTGAVSETEGRFQLADGGILFLDEIGDISANLQLRLLRVLETKEFQKVGDPTPVRVDVRVVAATNRDLQAQVAAGRFREDLYYRLNVMQVHLPSLRDRGEDVDMLSHHFIAKFNLKFGKQIRSLSSDVGDLFKRYDWPGNVRELENAIEHAAILCPRQVITVGHLPHHLQTFFSQAAPCQMAVTAGEEEAIRDALRQAGGNKAKAARLLKVSRKTIYRKIEKYNLAC